MAVGIVWGVAFMVWAACKHGGTTVTTTEEIEEPASNYKETKVTIPREAINEVLMEMGYPSMVVEDEKLKQRIKEVLEKDYSEFMTRVESAVAASRAFHDMKKSETAPSRDEPL
jgi:ribosomal protein L12E/L44/L45/RPP1/RPP2